MESAIKIRKWGDDLGIRIPSLIAGKFSLREGLYVTVHDVGRKIVIEPSHSSGSYNLAEMLDKITEDNTHNCIDTGIPTGNEVW